MRFPHKQRLSIYGDRRFRFYTDSFVCLHVFMSGRKELEDQLGKALSPGAGWI